LSRVVLLVFDFRLFSRSHASLLLVRTGQDVVAVVFFKRDCHHFQRRVFLTVRVTGHGQEGVSEVSSMLTILQRVTVGLKTHAIQEGDDRGEAPGWAAAFMRCLEDTSTGVEGQFHNVTVFFLAVTVMGREVEKHGLLETSGLHR
jgi:hypothetical protein